MQEPGSTCWGIRADEALAVVRVFDGLTSTPATHRFVDVGVQLQRPLAEGLFDVLHAGAALQAQQVIRVAPRGRHQHRPAPARLAAALPALLVAGPVPGLLLLPPAFKREFGHCQAQPLRG